MPIPRCVNTAPISDGEGLVEPHICLTIFLTMFIKIKLVSLFLYSQFNDDVMNFQACLCAAEHEEQVTGLRHR